MDSVEFSPLKEALGWNKRHFNLLNEEYKFIRVNISLYVFCRHECASGFYRVSAYFFAKILCDFIPMRFIPLCPFSAIAYFMIGLLPLRLHLNHFLTNAEPCSRSLRGSPKDWDIFVYALTSPDSEIEISLKIGQYLMKLRRTKVCQFFGPPSGQMQ